ncbi:TPA: glycosyltransferase family 2 protein [Providencia stuartii]
MPVYNVEKYIEKCIYSVKSQTFSDFEAIIINDGSPDNSIQLAKEIIKNDPRFIFLNKENGGLSSARNLGLHASRGEFVTFLDSDDYLEPSFLSEMIKYIDDNIDIISCNNNNVTDSGDVISKFTSSFLGEHTSNEIFKYFIESIKVSCVAWGKLYRRDLFFKNNILYPEGLLYEDYPITYKLYFFANSVYFTDLALVNYVQRPLSITKSFNSKVIEDSFWAIEDLHLFLKSKNILDKYYKQYNNAYLVHYVYRVLKQYVLSKPDYKQLVSFLDGCDKSLYSYRATLGLFSSSKKISVLLTLFKISLPLLRAILRIRK